jgi:hypothetical protein
VKVNVTGDTKVLKSLSTFDPEIAKTLGNNMSKIRKDIVADTKEAYTPRAGRLYNWRNRAAKTPRGRRNADGTLSTLLTRGGAGWPPWSVPNMRKGVKSSRRDLVVTVRVTEAAAAIYELAGSKTKGESPQGRAFISGLPPLFSRQFRGRALRPALMKHYARGRRIIDKDVADVIRTIQRMID